MRLIQNLRNVCLSSFSAIEIKFYNAKTNIIVKIAPKKKTKDTFTNTTLSFSPFQDIEFVDEHEEDRASIESEPEEEDDERYDLDYEPSTLDDEVSETNDIRTE